MDTFLSNVPVKVTLGPVLYANINCKALKKAIASFVCHCVYTEKTTRQPDKCDSSVQKCQDLLRPVCYEIQANIKFKETVCLLCLF